MADLTDLDGKECQHRAYVVHEAGELLSGFEGALDNGGNFSGLSDEVFAALDDDRYFACSREGERFDPCRDHGADHPGERITDQIVYPLDDRSHGVERSCGSEAGERVPFHHFGQASYQFS